jgi:hypothetical protein
VPDAPPLSDSELDLAFREGATDEEIESKLRHLLCWSYMIRNSFGTVCAVGRGTRAECIENAFLLADEHAVDCFSILEDQEEETRALNGAWRLVLWPPRFDPNPALLGGIVKCVRRRLNQRAFGEAGEIAMSEIEESNISATGANTALSAGQYERRTAAKLNALHQELRDQAQALFAAVKGWRGVHTEADWRSICEQAKLDEESGRFLIKRLGAHSYLEPELMATLGHLRKGLLAAIEHPGTADRMMADSAVIAYHNMLRVQGWIGSLCLTVERELFGQAPLSEIHGPTAGNQLAEDIARLEDVLMPLVDRCQRMMTRSIAHLEARRSKSAKPSVTVGHAGQVNVDCAVMNDGGWSP